MSVVKVDNARQHKNDINEEIKDLEDLEKTCFEKFKKENGDARRCYRKRLFVVLDRKRALYRRFTR